jgi:hypothetical protein
MIKRLVSIRKEYVKLKSVRLYFQDIMKRIFAKVVNGKDMYRGLLVGVGAKLKFGSSLNENIEVA